MPYTVIFFGTGSIALPLLRAIALDSRFKVVALVTQPDRAAGRGGELKKSLTNVEAQGLGIRVLKPEKLSFEFDFFQEMQKNRPDFFLTFAYGQLIPGAWLLLPRIAPLNVHPSLLPKYRGPSPIQASLLNGDMETGISLIKMLKEMDSGPLAGQVAYVIPPLATANTLMDELGNLAARVIPDWMIELTGKDPHERFSEQDHTKASFVKKIEKEDGHVNFQKSAEEIFLQFRAYASWPGIFTTYQGKRLKLLELEPTLEVLEAGKVRCNKHSISIGTSNGSLRIKRLQLEGKVALCAEQFILGQAQFCDAQLPS